MCGYDVEISLRTFESHNSIALLYVNTLLQICLFACHAYLPQTNVILHNVYLALHTSTFLFSKNPKEPYKLIPQNEILLK